MDIKSNLQLLAEAAAADTSLDIAKSAKLDTVKETYSVIDESDEMMVTEAADVIVTKTRKGEYYTEMVNIAPFMTDAGITSIAKALDMVAEANGLPEKSVGLVVESQSSVNATLDAAQAKSARTNNKKILENAINKVNKNNAIISKLLSEGFKVKKKSEDSKVCPKCGKAKCKCECGSSCGGGNASVKEASEVISGFFNLPINEATEIASFISTVNEIPYNDIVECFTIIDSITESELSAKAAKERFNDLLKDDKKRDKICTIIGTACLALAATGLIVGWHISFPFGIGILAGTAIFEYIVICIKACSAYSDFKNLKRLKNSIDKSIDKLDDKIEKNSDDNAAKEARSQLRKVRIKVNELSDKHTYGGKAPSKA